MEFYFHLHNDLSLKNINRMAQITSFFNPPCDRLIPEGGPAAKNGAGVKRLIFCSGKVYFDLTAARKEAGLEDTIAISRVEQVGSVFIYLVFIWTSTSGIYICFMTTYTFLYTLSRSLPSLTTW